MLTSVPRPDGKSSAFRIAESALFDSNEAEQRHGIADYLYTGISDVLEDAERVFD